MTTQSLDDPKIPILRVGPDFRFFEAICSAARSDAFQSIHIPGDASKYIVILAVCDYVRISHEPGPAGILAALNEDLVRDIKNGYARLLLDLSNEGPAFYKEIFSDLNRQLDHLSIPHDAVTFISQNRRLQSDYQDTFPQKKLKFWSLDFFPSTIMAAFNEGANLSGLGDYRPFGILPDKAFNCLNAAPRWHRILMFRWLQQKNLLDDGLVSFHGVSPENRKSAEIDLAAPPGAVAAHFADLLPTAASDLPAQPIRFDVSKSFGNELATSVLVDAYARSSLSIVTESDFFGPPIRRITEKTVKALVMGHPFIVIGPAGSLDVVQSFGFRTFSSVIDPGYDSEVDDAKRFSACLRTIEACLALIRSDRDRWIALCRDDAEFNFHHGRHGFATSYKQGVLDPVIRELQAFVAS